jgi:hypothetical protein
MAAEPVVREKKQDHSLRDFGGVNTQADRRAIGDDEFAWLENVMPIGRGNARTVPGPSAALATLGATCYYMAEGNISNVSYMFMFCTNGSCYQVNLTTYAIATVGAAGTFSGTLTHIAQWKNERIVIIDNVYGYFDWNGATLTTYKGALASVTVNFGGTGFTNATTTTLTPSSGAATFTATLDVNSATLHAAAAGTGYIVGDVLTIVGGTFTSPCTLTVSSIGASGAIAGFNLTTTGIYTIATGVSAIAVTGGHGTAATFDLTYGIHAVTMTAPGTGYVTAPTITVGGAGAGTAAVLTVNLAINTTGTTIAVYAGRVWIGNNRTIVYSAPNTYNDFNPTDLAGSFVMTDDTMKSSIVRLFSSNSFLYVISANSVNVISNVTVTAPVYTSTGSVITPSVTVFSNSNLTPDAGTDMHDSVVAVGRTIALAVDYGFIGITGATPSKFSDELDGVFPLFDLTQFVSAGTAVILNIKCLCFLVKYNDPLTGTARQLLCVSFNKKWYFSSQVATMTFVATASPDPDYPALWATNGNTLYKLFSNTTENLAQIIQTKLWDMGSPLITKEAFKLGLETKSPSVPATLSVNIDTENSTQNYTLSGGNTMVWTNNSGVVINWTNNMAAPIIWTAAGYLMKQQNVENVGNYLGITAKSSTQGLTYIGFHLQFADRTKWTTVP